jgi:hypothetical protein
MSAAGPIDLTRVPSLHLVEGALTREEDSYRLRAAGIDTKAGILLSAAGVLIALVGNRPGIAGLIGQAFAVGAAGTGAWALFPRVDKSIGPRQLRDRYLTQDPSITRMVLLNTRIDLHAHDEQQLLAKARRLRITAFLLLTASITVFVGAMVETIWGGGK